MEECRKIINLGVVVSSPLFVRSWFSTGIIEKLSSTSRLTLYVGNRLWLSDVKVPKGVQVVDIELETDWRYEAIWLAQKLSLARTNSSYRQRLERIFLGDFLWFPGGKISKKIWALSRGFFTLLTAILSKPYYLILLNKALNRGLQSFLTRSLGNHRFADQIRVLSEHDFVVFPSLGQSGALFRLCAELGQAKVPFAIILDNWDNLTSKSLLPTNVSFVNLLGKSSIKLAKRTQSLADEQLEVMGIPRFEPYRQESGEFWKLQEEHSSKAGPKRILYLGYSVRHHEVRFVNRLFEALKDRLQSNFVLDYRPHPAGPKLELNQIHPNIRVSTVDERRRIAGGGLPDLNQAYFQALLTADVVIGPPTTMLIEAGLCKKTVIVDVHSDGYHRTSAGLLWHKYEHMKDLIHVPGLIFGDTYSSLIEAVVEAVDADGSSVVPADWSHLVDHRAPEFADRLIDAICRRLS